MMGGKRKNGRNDASIDASDPVRRVTEYGKQAMDMRSQETRRSDVWRAVLFFFFFFSCPSSRPRQVPILCHKHHDNSSTCQGLERSIEIALIRGSGVFPPNNHQAKASPSTSNHVCSKGSPTRCGPLTHLVLIENWAWKRNSEKRATGRWWSLDWSRTVTFGDGADRHAGWLVLENEMAARRSSNPNCASREPRSHSTA